MKIPMRIRIKKEKQGEEKTYIFVKEYSNFLMYRDEKTGKKECFTKSELGIAKEMIRPPRYINVENAKK